MNPKDIENDNDNDNDNIINILKKRNQLISQNLDIYTVDYSQQFKNETNKYCLCPFCKRNIPLIFPIIDRISINLLLFLVCDCGEQKIITLKELFSVNINNSKNILDSGNNCDICLSNEEQENILFCLKCGIWQCKNCREIVYKDEEKEHIHLNKKLNIKTLCPIHEIYYNLYYCLNCKKGICPQCLKKEHKYHEYISMNDFYLNVNNKFKNIYLNNKNYFNKRTLDKTKSQYFNNISYDYNFEKKIENKINLEKEQEVKSENIYNIIQKKIELNIRKIKKDFSTYFISDLKIKSNDINEINEYIINYYRLNIQLLYLIQFIYNKFLLLGNYNNINIINNMNLLTNFNVKEFSVLNLFEKNNDNLLKTKSHDNIVHFKQTLKNFIYNDTIINLEEGIINFQFYNNFMLLKDEKVKDFLIINDYDYLILTNINLLYFSTYENIMYKIIPKYHQRIDFDIIKQYEINQNSFSIINYKNENNKNNINNINIIINDDELSSSNDINHTLSVLDYNIDKKLTFDMSKSNNDNFNHNITSEPKNHFLKKKKSVLLTSPIVLNQNITSICKYYQNQILVCYKTNIIKCIFSKVNNELLLVKIIKVIPAHKKSIYLINVLTNGNVITVSEDKTLKIWNLSTSNISNTNDKCLYTINKRIFCFYEKINNNINNDKDVNYLICFGRKKGFLLSRNAKFNNLKNIINHKDIVKSILINSNNDIITGSLDGYIKKTNINNFQEDKKLFMGKGIISFNYINDNNFGVIIKDLGLFIINSLELTKISYVKNNKDKIILFGNLGNGLFYAMLDKENDNDKKKKENNDSNININILEVTMGKNGKYIVFS